MSKKQVISCSSREEMRKIAERLMGQGCIVKTVEGMTPFHPYGLCVQEYKVIIQNGSMDGKRAERPDFLKWIPGGTTWRSDWHKTSVLSENNAL